VILWRVSNHATLDGAGGLRASARWHSRGKRVVYGAPNPATALLEVLVHLEIDLEDIPVAFRYLEIHAPESIATRTAEAAVIPFPGRTEIATTRKTGDDWLRSGHSALLHVLSVIVPATWNVLINPRHPESAQIRIARVHDFPIDLRLLR